MKLEGTSKDSRGRDGATYSRSLRCASSETRPGRVASSASPGERLQLAPSRLAGIFRSALGTITIFLCFLSCTAAPRISPEQKAHLNEIWASYLKKDSSWPAKREAAVQNKEDRDFLIQNLIRELVRQTDATGSAQVGRSAQALRAQEELVRLGEFSLPWLLAFFEVDDPAVGNICGQVLSSMGKRAVPFLKQELKSPEPRRRRGCVQALARMSPPEGEEELIQLLAEDPDWVVRAAIATELPRFGNPEIWAALQKALSDPDPFVRKKATAAMEALKKESGTP